MSLRKTSKFALGIIIPVFIISAYLILQISTVAAYNNFCRNVVLSTHLTDIQFLDTSPKTLQKGIFTASFTFENPQNQTVNITSMSAVLFPTSPGIFPLALGQGSIKEPITLGNGETHVIPQMNLTQNATLTTPSYWDIDYALKFGSVNYSFNSSTEPIAGLPPLRTYGPYSAGEDTALTQATTYSLLTIDAWTIGLEAIAVFILLQERKNNKTMHAEATNDHTRMAAIIYALEGTLILVLPQFALFLQTSVIPHPPPEFAYGGHGVGGILSDFLTVAYYIAAVILLAISLGLFLRIDAAKSTAYYLSWIIATIGFLLSVSLFANQLFWSSATAAQNLALGTLILAITLSNILVAYTLSKRDM